MKSREVGVAARYLVETAQVWGCIYSYVLQPVQLPPALRVECCALLECFTSLMGSRSKSIRGERTL